MGADIEFLHYISTISPEGADGDFIDALIVGMDLLIRKTAGKRYEKRVFLVTDAGCPVNQDDLDVVCEQFLKIDARLNVIGVGFREDDDNEQHPLPSSDDASSPKVRNERLIRSFAERVHGVVVPVLRGIEMMSFIKPKSVLQRTSHRGTLEVSPHIKIPVWCYIKTMERKLPSLKKVSAVSQHAGDEGGDGGSMEVKMERIYHAITDPDKEVEPDGRVKGYKYGKTIVPFSMVDENALAYDAQKCLQLIGFTSASNVPRHHYLSNVECIVAEPGDAQAGVALSALAHALAETGSLAIVRYVKRSKGNPYLGCLSPHVKPERACLYFNALPFAEDLRQYPFGSLARPLRKAYVPSEEQLEVAQALIDSMDLMAAATDDDGNPIEAVKPKHTYNPAFQTLCSAVLHRAQHPDDPSLPPVNATIEAAMRPDRHGAMAEMCKPALARFQSLFPLAPVEAGTSKVERRYWRDRLADTDVQLDSYVPEAKKQRRRNVGEEEEEGISMESLMTGATSDVGPINPEMDFNDMLARRDVDLVDRAVEQMRGRIKQLVEESVSSQFYDKALKCLLTLRHGCMIEDEHQKYNEFVAELSKYYQNKRRDDFWQMVCARNLHTPLRDTAAAPFGLGSPASADLTAPSMLSSTTTGTSDQKSGDSEQEATADDLFDMVE